MYFKSYYIIKIVIINKIPNTYINKNTTDLLLFIIFKDFKTIIIYRLSKCINYFKCMSINTQSIIYVNFTL